MRITVGASTDVGRVRERNEDSYLVKEPLYAVADGMGGHRGGDVASSMTLEALAGADLGSEDEGGPLDVLVERIKGANDSVLDAGEREERLRGMGTTITAIVTGENRAWLAHVGDSRAYLLRNGAFQRLTTDHTLVERMVQEGRLEAAQARHHPQRSILTRALGVDRELSVDELTLDPIHPEDRVLLCTDGLTSMIEDDEVERILTEEADPQAACDRLVAAALEAGGDDNVTVIVLDFSEGEGTSLPADAGGATAAVPAGATTAVPRAEHRSGPAPASAGEPVTVVGAPGFPIHREEDDEEDEEPEEGRGGVRWGRVAVWVGALIVVLAAAAYGARIYVDHQWYVGESEGRVAIFNGIPTTVLGYDLFHLEEATDLSAAEAERLQPWRELAEGITASSLADARGIVQQIRADLAPPSGGGGSGA